MIKTIKIRLYPTIQQKKILNHHFGAVRYLYNLGLEYKQIMYKNYGIKTTKFDLINQLPDVKEGAPWLKKCKAECLQSTFDNLDSAFLGFYQGAGFPKFKSKHKSISRDELARIDASGQQAVATGRRKKRTSKKLSL